MAETHKLRITDPKLSQALVTRGANLVADYGSFQLVEADDSLISSNRSERLQLADEDDLIHLNSYTINTRKSAAQDRRKSVSAFAGKRLHLVHFAGPVKPEWFAELKQQGVEVVGHVPRNAYLIYGDARALSKVQSWARTAAFVQWDGEYADDFKLHPRARSRDEKGNPRNPGTDLFAIQMLDDPAANATTLSLVDQLKIEPLKRDYRSLGYRNMIVRLPPNQLARLTARPEVVSIQPFYAPRKNCEIQDQIMAGNLTAGVPDGPGYLGWLTSHGFTQAQFDASGFVVDLSDSGIDNGTTTPGHFGLYRLGDPNSTSRLAYNRLEGAANWNSTLAGCDGHGTLNAHILAGYVSLSNDFPHADSAGYYYGLGVCPFVKVGSSVIFDPDNFTFPDYTELQASAYHDGARISANSWGASVSGMYDLEAQAFDALVRDAQPASSTNAAAGNQEMVIVFSAGNDGPTSTSIGSPGSAKNVITIGASENVRSLSIANGGNALDGEDGCTSTDEDADNAEDMVSFSSRGPCADGRMKPDLVAPGTHITGGVAQDGTPTTNGLGTALACFSATGVCGLPGSGSPANPNNFFPLGQEYYSVSSGTSHSTPAVAGACALLRQYFINQGRPAPSPAMTKAWLMNTTRHLTGVDANDSFWSPSQGMGAADLGRAFDDTQRLVHDQLSYEKFTASGQTRTFVGTIPDPTRPFRVTLAWTDAPGTTYADAFNNDLDLTVTAGGVTYKGNVFSGAISATGGTSDQKNNVESVLLPAGLSGEFVITVTAADINSDGVPNEDPALDQDFALVAYNANEMVSAVITPDSWSLQSEGNNPTNGVVDPGETVTVKLVLKNSGNLSTTNLVATLLETNGVYGPSAAQTYGIIPAEGGVVTQAFSFLALGTCGQTIHPTLHLQDGATDLGLVNFPVFLGRIATSLTQATNSQTITVPAYGTVGSGTPFPSVLSVSGITGTVSKVIVTLVGVTHTFPDDLDVLLVGPTGTNVMIMSDCGGANSLSDATLEFSDDAALTLPDSGPISSGTYRPSNYGPLDSFSSPAPAGPFGQNLSVFSGINPNGDWLLYVQDDSAQDTGSIAQGWRISITTSDTVCNGTANQPPVLSPVADRTIHAGSTLVITNSATDPDATNSLVFSLATNAPANAIIDANSGVLTWPTTGNLAGTTNAITVKVTDNGYPSLSDSTSFDVIIVPPPAFQSIELSNASPFMTWSAISGQTYRLQYRTNLILGSWSNLTPVVTATGPAAAQSDTNFQGAQRFYRVQVLP